MAITKESIFQSHLVKELYELFPGCVIVKSDSGYLQGFPDLIILFENKWAVLESKRSPNSSKRVNQEYYVKTLGKMSYASFICPENKAKVLNELQQALRLSRPTRISKRK